MDAGQVINVIYLDWLKWYIVYTIYNMQSLTKCMYVCVCVYRCVCACVYMRVLVGVYTHVCVCLCSVYIFIYSRTGVHSWITTERSIRILSELHRCSCNALFKLMWCVFRPSTGTLNLLGEEDDNVVMQPQSSGNFKGIRFRGRWSSN